MNKIILLLALIFISTTVFSQKEKELKLNEETNLIEATYYHDNGVISQKGTFNLDRKLHGTWISYDEGGIKVSEGSYINGAKSGKWLFWNEGTVKEVEFSNNAVASVITKESSIRSPN